MKINSIAQYINDEYSYLNGDTSVTLENDLSNLVDFGEHITSDSTFTDTFKTKFGNILAKVSKTIIHETKCEMPVPPVFTDSIGYYGALEHLMIDVSDFVNNETYHNTNTFEKLFGEEMPTVNATYYNTKDEFSLKITRLLAPYIDSFTSENSFNSFWAGVIARIETKIKFAFNRLAYDVFMGKICTSVHTNNRNNVVELNIPNTDDYTPFISKIKTTIRKMLDFNTDYSDGYINSTDKSNLVLCMRGDVYDKMTTSKAYALNDKFLDIPIDNIVPLNTFGDLEHENAIEKIVPLNDSEKITSINNIVAILYDKRGARAYDENHVVNSQPVANKKGMINYFYLFDVNYVVINGYKCVVFTENGKNDVTLNKTIE